MTDAERIDSTLLDTRLPIEYEMQVASWKDASGTEYWGIIIEVGCENTKGMGGPRMLCEHFCKYLHMALQIASGMETVKPFGITEPDSTPESGNVN